jgi:hypothetical protein
MDASIVDNGGPVVRFIKNGNGVMGWKWNRG